MFAGVFADIFSKIFCSSFPSKFLPMPCRDFLWCSSYDASTEISFSVFVLSVLQTEVLSRFLPRVSARFLCGILSGTFPKPICRSLFQDFFFEFLPGLLVFPPSISQRYLQMQSSGSPKGIPQIMPASLSKKTLAKALFLWKPRETFCKESCRTS